MVTLIFCSSVKAQEFVTEEPGGEQIRKNSVYLEIMGHGAVYSLNYERVFNTSEKNSAAYQVPDKNDCGINLVRVVSHLTIALWGNVL